MTVSGMLIYDPRKKGRPFKPWVVVLEYPSHLFQSLVKRVETERGVILHPSKEGPLIDVIIGEQPFYETRWRRFDRHMVEFEIVDVLQTDGHNWWMVVSAPELVDIRLDLGLAKLPGAGFFLFLGTTKKRK